MNCGHARRLAWETRAGENLAAAGRGLRRHLRHCAACARAVGEQTWLARLLEEWQVEAEPGADFDARLQARVAAALSARRAWSWVAAWRAGREWAREWTSGRAAALFAAAALLAVLVIGGGAWFLARRNTASPRLAARGADAAVHDLQVLDRDGEMLENFNLISQPTAAQSGSAGAVVN